MKLTDEERKVLETRRVRGPVHDEKLADRLVSRGLLLPGCSRHVQKLTYETTNMGLAALANKD